MMPSKTGTTLGKSRTVNSLTLPSASLRKHLVHIVKLIQAHRSLATETDYVRGKLADHANDLFSLGTDGLRLDAAKRKSHYRLS